jgi:hypothetical protein
MPMSGRQALGIPNRALTRRQGVDATVSRWASSRAERMTSWRSTGDASLAITCGARSRRPRARSAPSAVGAASAIGITASLHTSPASGAEGRPEEAPTKRAQMPVMVRGRADGRLGAGPSSALGDRVSWLIGRGGRQVSTCASRDLQLQRFERGQLFALVVPVPGCHCS